MSTADPPNIDPWIAEQIGRLNEPELRKVRDLLDTLAPVPFDPGTGPMPGYYAGRCGHRVAISEWNAGFRTCERCPDDEPAGHRHTWVAGIMAVHDEDLDAVYAERAARGETIDCETCDAVYEPANGAPR
jgi:hypothetical protein